MRLLISSAPNTSNRLALRDSCGPLVCSASALMLFRGLPHTAAFTVTYPFFALEARSMNASDRSRLLITECHLPEKTTIRSNGLPQQSSTMAFLNPWAFFTADPEIESSCQCANLRKLLCLESQQLGILGLCLFQDRYLRFSIFPKHDIGILHSGSIQLRLRKIQLWSRTTSNLFSVCATAFL